MTLRLNLRTRVEAGENSGQEVNQRNQVTAAGLADDRSPLGVSGGDCEPFGIASRRIIGGPLGGRPGLAGFRAGWRSAVEGAPLLWQLRALRLRPVTQPRCPGRRSSRGG